MLLVDALVTVANRHHATWALSVDNIVVLRRATAAGAEYLVRVLSDPATELWTAVIATPQPDDVVLETLEAALAWLVTEGYRESLISDGWLTTAHGAA